MITVIVLIAAVLPLLATALAAFARTATPSRVADVAIGAMAVSFAASVGLVVASGVADDGVPGGLIDLPDWTAIGIDRVSAVLLAASTGIGLIVASFSKRSLDAGSPRTPDYFVALTAVAGGSALVIVPGGPLPLLLGWFVSGRALVSLAGGWVDAADARRAHRRANTTMVVSDVALAAAVVVAVSLAGSGAVFGSPLDIARLELETLLGVSGQVVVALLVVIAGAARSSLFPFHRWLTATLYAPTPVSALVHAGFVSGAGLLLIRFAPTVLAAELAVALVIVLAGTSIVIGTAGSLIRSDAKGALAWSTVAQMAFMTLQVAVGAIAGAVFHIVGHGMYKAAQFLGVGDTVSAQLRARRRPVVTQPLPTGARSLVTVAIATGATALGVLVGPSGLEGDERLLLVAFAWSAIAAGVYGLLGSTGTGRGTVTAIAATGAVVASLAYFVGIDLAKRFLEPSIAPVDVAVDGAVIAVVAVVALLAVVVFAPGSVGRSVRPTARWWAERLTAVRAPLAVTSLEAGPASGPAAATGASLDTDEARVGAAELRAHVARAAELVAPSWPLTSFVAVNPLGGLEQHSFDDAAAEARRWTRGRTHRTMSQYRSDHAAGLSTDADLAYAVVDVAMVACSQPAVETHDAMVEPSEIVLADLLHGPEKVDDVVPRTELERRLGADAGELLAIDELVSGWLAGYVVPATWALVPEGSSFLPVVRSEAIRHAQRRLDPAAVAWLESLGDDPAEVLAAALDAAGVAPDARLDELRGHLVSLAGWTGVARWRTDWAQADEASPMLRPLDVAAARAMVEGAVIVSIEAAGHGRHHERASTVEQIDDADPDAALAARVDAVIDRLGLPADPASAERVAEILSMVTEPMRSAIWLRAQERHFEDQMLGELGARPSTVTDRPDAQVVLCIDVRSEGFRRQLEAQGHDHTLGFAGFFGVPMAVRELGWAQNEARCPVLVSPAAGAVEEPLVDHIGDAAREIGRSGIAGAMAAAHSEIKHVPGAAFTAAETFGWFSGPRAAWRTLHSSETELRAPLRDTTVRLEAAVGIEQRIFTAESVLRTMGLVDGFADLVVLSGHTSSNVNNAHATALECGACAGASGAANARAVASLLNESDVRTGLVERGIEIPDETWFVGAVHDTSTDAVTILDRHVSPATHHAQIDALQERLDRAGEAQAGVRAAALPGAADAADVRRRGSDWAQVRAEWGLAGNAAFVIAPREVTDGLDLGGRAFLHSYDAEIDPQGNVLEAIMTAPLVVGHWISSQYYFSTVDSETFGAGDKLLHNPVGGLGVLTGAGGDLRVGLPAQSTHVDGAAHHQPMRLLAVVQADINVVESIIARNEVLTRLVNGSWLRIAARSGPDAAWAVRSAGGTWSELPSSGSADEPSGVSGHDAESDAASDVRDDRVGVG